MYLERNLRISLYRVFNSVMCIQVCHSNGSLWHTIAQPNPPHHHHHHPQDPQPSPTQPHQRALEFVHMAVKSVCF